MTLTAEMYQILLFPTLAKIHLKCLPELILGKLGGSLDWIDGLCSQHLPDGKLDTDLSLSCINNLEVSKDVLQDGLVRETTTLLQCSEVCSNHDDIRG